MQRGEIAARVARPAIDPRWLVGPIHAGRSTGSPNHRS